LASFGSKPGQHGCQLQQRSLGLPAGTAHHDQIIGEADQHTVPTNIPGPVNPVQVNVRQQR
jgi:hypothetical protein